MAGSYWAAFDGAGFMVMSWPDEKSARTALGLQAGRDYSIELGYDLEEVTFADPELRVQAYWIARAYLSVTDPITFARNAPHTEHRVELAPSPPKGYTLNPFGSARILCAFSDVSRENAEYLRDVAVAKLTQQ